MWRRAGWTWVSRLRRFSTATRCCLEDEGDWLYSSEWWGSNCHDDLRAHIVLQSTSDKGNGVVSVLAYPSSRPEKESWPETEKWLQKRYAEIHPDHGNIGQIRILGYQWRILRFNDDTRQSTVKIMATCLQDANPSSVYLVQQPHCLAVPYLKSMVSIGLSTIASCNYDLMAAALGEKRMNVLCIGHGGGSLPLFLASKLKGARVDIVEIDPVVISASVGAMGFPSFSVMTPSGKRARSDPHAIDEVLWKGIHERLNLYESDAERFIIENRNLYDMIFIDAYDGDDIFPYKLWDQDSPFLQSLSTRLHPEHGTVVVNLHSDDLDCDDSLRPDGKYISRICQAYKHTLVAGKNDSFLGGAGSGTPLGLTVSVPWVCNTSLVVCRGFRSISRSVDRHGVMNTLVLNSNQVESLLNLPFSCLHYIKRGLTLVE